MGIYVGDKRYAPYVGSTRRKVMIVKGYDVKYPIVNVINGVNYYRFTPNETFVVYSGTGSGGDVINYFRFGETTRYDYNRLWGGEKSYTGPNVEPPRYFTLAFYTSIGYIYNRTRKEWLYRGADVPEDKFDN